MILFIHRMYVKFQNCVLNISINSLIYFITDVFYLNIKEKLEGIILFF